MNAGFISTRFAGLDGVSLEASKWAEVLWREFKIISFWFSGKSDRSDDISYIAEKSFFQHPDIIKINDAVLSSTRRNRETTNLIYSIKEELKNQLYDFIEKFSIDFLVVENALTIPMNIPLGIAVTELINETNIFTIAHHHDFFWERDRYIINAVIDFIEMAFPPKGQSIAHVVINTPAQEELASRKGISSIVIPNVINFSKEPYPIDDFSKSFRRDFGIDDDETVILQPTRVVSRKGIEHTFELIHKLRTVNPARKYRVIISQASADEGQQYPRWLKKLGEEYKLNILYLENRLQKKRGYTKSGKKLYTLWDVYPHADIITYPSLYEGFGNAFIEAIYFKKPIVVNRYSIYVKDIEPKNFYVIPMDGHITDEVVEKTDKILKDKLDYRDMVEYNFQLGKNHYSYEVLKQKFRVIFLNYLGMDLSLNS